MPSLRGLDRLERLDVGDNPFDCADCRQTPFVGWLNRSTGVRLDRRQHLVCAERSPLAAGPSIFDAAADCPYVAALPVRTRGRPDSAGGRAGTLTAALLAAGLAGLAVALAATAVACRYRRLFPRLKSLHCIQHWQVRYREVSDLETTLR